MMIFPHGQQGQTESHVEEVSLERIIAKTSQENAQEPTSVARGWVTHSRPHNADVVTKKLRYCG